MLPSWAGAGVGFAGFWDATEYTGSELASTFNQKKYAKERARPVDFLTHGEFCSKPKLLQYFMVKDSESWPNPGKTRQLG